MRCIQAVRSSIRVWRIRARDRHWRTCSGGIHASGSRPSASSLRSQRASSRSVFARRLRPRSARVSTGSARCGVAPAADSASQTNSQPVHASTATSISRPAKRATQRATAAGVESIRPRITSPVSVSNASKVICARCTSNPATIAIRASSEAPVLPPRASLSRRAEEALAHAIFAHPLLAAAAREAASRTTRRQMHARLAEVVEEGEARARHLALAAVGRDRRIARVLDDAAARARRRGDLYAAAELGELALGMTPLGDSALAERQLRVGQARRVTGQAERARHLAAAAYDAAADGRLRAAALRLLAAVAPDEPGALALCDRALDDARAAPRLLVEVRGERTNRLMALGRQEAAVAEARQTVAAAEHLGDRELLAAALALFAWQSRLAGQSQRAQLDQAVAMAPESHVGWFGYSPTVCRAVSLVWDDRLDE